MKLLIAMATLFVLPIFSQHKTESKELFTLFDQTIGIKNTDLSYGTLFVDKYRKLDGNHQFLNTDEFKKGTVTYQNQVFYNVFLKYDLADDHLIVNLSSDFENRSIILEKALVDSFIIENKKFKKNNEYGYLEIINTTEKITFYKKNSRTKKKKLNESFVYYKFLENDIYYLKYGEKIYEINRKKDIIKIFPQQKKMINNFYKTQKNLKKQNIDNFYKLLSTKLSSNTTNE